MSLIPRVWRRVLRGLGVVLVVAASGYAYYLSLVIPIGAANKAKVVCSGIFNSGLPLDKVVAEEAGADWFESQRPLSATVDWTEKTVTSDFMGIGRRTAVYRPEFGCTLAIGTTPGELRRQTANVRFPVSVRDDNMEWPVGDTVSASRPHPDVNIAALKAVVGAAFTEPNPERLRRTRAVVIVRHGRIVAEQYASPVTPQTPLIGHSMSKSVTNALVGVLIGDGKLSLDGPVGLREWSGAGDPRGKITLDQLLRMSSGLEFLEQYANPFSDIPGMMLMTGDAAGYAAAKPLSSPPGTKWLYSSGTTNILALLMKRALGGAGEAYFTFPRRRLFNRIGMKNVLFEVDASGTFIGSSFVFATARDWARLGQLYLQDGVWQGQRILPEGWVKYSSTPAPAAPGGIYGAQFWLRVGKSFRSARDAPIMLPRDLYTMEGFGGQFVTIVPSLDLVIVRMGLSLRGGAWDHEQFVAGVAATLRSDIPSDDAAAASTSQ